MKRRQKQKDAMNLSSGKKGRRADKIFVRGFLGVFVCAVGIGVFGQAKARETLQKERLEVAAQIQEEEKKQQEFEKNKEYYNSDTYIEQIAKEQLGMIKPNEVLYINRSQ